MAANVEFTVRHQFDAPARAVWDELVDWKGHAEWIPMTRVDVDPGDPTEPGAEFVAYTGVGKLSLEDRMRVVHCDWDEATSTGDCEVTKLGPILTGRAAFTVEPHAGGSVVHWVEDIRVPVLPQFLAPVAAKIGAVGFGQGMRGLAKILRKRSTSG